MLAPPPITDSPPDALDLPVEMVPGVFEPPSGFVLSALGRNKAIVLLCAVVLALVGLAIGKTRKVTYTASATLQVGQVNPNSPGFLGYVQSSSALATAFSRSIGAEPVLAAVQKKLKLSPSDAIARLSAEPLPEAPAFEVIATGTTKDSAVGLANVAASAVIAYEGQSNSANPEAATLLHEYREAAYQLQQATLAFDHLTLKGKSVSNEVHARAEAAKNAAEVRLKAIGNSYVAAVTSQAPRNGLVSLLAGATGASNNHHSKIELFGFIGLLAGLAVGCLAAVLRERLRMRPRRA